MVRKIIIGIMVLVFLAGLGFFLYPYAPQKQWYRFDIYINIYKHWGFPGSSAGKECTCNAGD